MSSFVELRSLDLFVLIIFFGCLQVVSCVNPANHATTKRPNAQHILGTWIPDQESLEYMQHAGGYDMVSKPTLILKSDDTYVMADMPDWFWLDDGKSHKQLRSERGTWELQQSGDNRYWIVLLKNQIKSRGLSLLDSGPPYRLRFYFGNVDTNPQTMTFRRNEP